MMYATSAEYWEGQWSYGTLSVRVTDDTKVWTVSLQPDAPGWNTDGGTSGYGMSEGYARFLAESANYVVELAKSGDKRAQNIAKHLE
jgi:hypothetical protein